MPKARFIGASQLHASRKLGQRHGRLDPVHGPGKLADAVRAWQPTYTEREIVSAARRRRVLKKRLKASGKLFPQDKVGYPHLAARADNLLESARIRAQVQRVPFTLKAKWILDRLIAGKCEQTGLAFDHHRLHAPADGLRSNFGASLDRIVPSLGYTPENCQLVVWAYNAAKGSGTDAEVMRMAQALIARRLSTHVRRMRQSKLNAVT